MALALWEERQPGEAVGCAARDDPWWAINEKSVYEI
jgi:hypothetical protein